MDKTPVNTRTLEEELVERILTVYSGSDSGVDASVDVKAAVADFRTKFEDECWEAWRIAQAFERSEEHDRFLDEKRVFEQQQSGFRAAVGAYNREREKEGKNEQKFELPEQPARDDMQYGGGDCCSDPEHDHEAQPASTEE
jgi:hypothetical protein